MLWKAHRCADTVEKWGFTASRLTGRVAPWRLVSHISVCRLLLATSQCSTTGFCLGSTQVIDTGGPARPWWVMRPGAPVGGEVKIPTFMSQNSLCWRQWWQVTKIQICGNCTNGKFICCGSVLYVGIYFSEYCSHFTPYTEKKDWIYSILFHQVSLKICIWIPIILFRATT